VPARTAGLVAGFILLLLLACAKPPEPPPPVEVVNEELGIRLNSLPEGLAVAENHGENLELRPATPEKQGAIRFFVGPETHAVNLVQAVNDHRMSIEKRPGGEYLGAQELIGDFGSAFYSRGKFLRVDDPFEETVVYAIHSTGNRLVSIRSQYPAATDSAARVEELIDLLSRMEWHSTHG
jgi:hypothetical protein